MEVENFKAQQQDRADEGKELKREDELTDLSKIATDKLPGAESKSILSKISEGISNVAATISDKIGYNPVIEGHEDLDRDVKKQVKKINKEILSKHAEGGLEAKPSEWEKSLPQQVKKEVDNAKDSAEGLVKKVSQKVDEVKDSGNLSSNTTIQPNREGPSPLDKVNEQYDKVASKVEDTLEGTTTQTKQGTSLLGKVQQGVQGLSDSISHGVENLKSKFSKGDDANEREDDGTKRYRSVQDGFEQSVDDLKHEKRVEELGGQEELNSQNPFKPLDSGSDNKAEGENQSLGGKIKDSLNNAGNKITTQVEGATQKVKATFASKAPQDKENAQQIA